MPRKVESTDYLPHDRFNPNVDDNDAEQLNKDLTEKYKNESASEAAQLGEPIVHDYHLMPKRVSAWGWVPLAVLLALGATLVAVSAVSLSGKEVTNPFTGNLLNETQSVLGVVGGGALTILTIGAGIKFNMVRNKQKHFDLAEENVEEL